MAIVSGTLTLINDENLVYVLATWFLYAGYNICVELKLEKRNILSLVINSIVLVISILIFTKLI